MKRQADWAIPADLQPSAEGRGFDLDAAIEAVVSVRTEVPEDAFTASTLGTERAGSGVVVRGDGIVATIGYLLTEAERVWLTTNDGRVVQGHVLGYDQVSGLGIVQALGKLRVPAMPVGDSTALKTGDPVVVIGEGGRRHSLDASVVAKREFAGYWEYVLDEALFTAPAHPQWGGTAVVDAAGRLVGIGSLLVEEKVGRKRVQGNMSVPAELLPALLEDILAHGRSKAPPRPWLGLYVGEAKEGLVVGGVARGGPSERAGLQEGDVLLEVAGGSPTSLASFFRSVWRLGLAGTQVPLKIRRGGEELHIPVRSGDRNDFLKKPSLH
jgi:S1-C subfamily serine protease